MNPDVRVAALRFGAYELDLAAGQLRRSGIHIKLRPQAFRVLVLLASRSGELVTRDELRNALWSDGTIVDFEQGLNFCIRQARTVLSDDAVAPRFIETVPRHGYRFLAPVTTLPVQRSNPTEVATSADHVPQWGIGRWAWAIAAALVVLVPLAAVWWSNRGSGDVAHPWRPVPLTTYPGTERNPALAPDGVHVAFTWDGPAQDNFDIYIKPLGLGEPRRITMDPAEDVSPAWSPDGLTLAFLRRQSGDRQDVILVPAFGGPEHKIGQVETSSRLPSLTWSPDGAWLVTSHRESAEENEALFSMSVRTGEKRRLTNPPLGFSGDYMPAFSSDSRAIAFARLSGWSASEIYLLSLSGDRPVGDAHPITNEGRWAVSPVWKRDGRTVVYLSGDNGGRMEMRSVRAFERDRSERLAHLEGDAFQLSLSSHLIYSRETSDTNIWRAEIGEAEGRPATGQVFIASTWQDWQPRYSPNGDKITFGSTRSGAREIWIADADGSNAAQLTSFSGPFVGFMNWSPNGHSLVFHARPDGQADLFTVSARSSGTPVRLTTHAADDVTASYSHDGRWIYFASLRSGQWEAWKMLVAGGSATQISHTGGVEMPLESADGRSIFYCIPGNGIWRVPVEGGESVRMVGPIAPSCAFAVDAEGLYYSAPADSGHRGAIRFFSFAEAQSRPIVISERPLGMGLTVSPDGRRMLFTRIDQSGSDLMLIGNFDPR